MGVGQIAVSADGCDFPERIRRRKLTHYRGDGAHAPARAGAGASDAGTAAAESWGAASLRGRGRQDASQHARIAGDDPDERDGGALRSSMPGKAPSPTGVTGARCSILVPMRALCALSGDLHRSVVVPRPKAGGAWVESGR